MTDKYEYNRNFQKREWRLKSDNSLSTLFYLMSYIWCSGT